MPALIICGAADPAPRHSFVIRSVTRKLLKSDASNLESVAKILLLAEAGYQPSGTGKLEEGPEPRIPFINQFAFTLRTYAEAGGMKAADVATYFGDNAFNQLRRAKNVRDRLTHPKKLSDITVTPADVLDVTSGFNWASRFILKIEGLLRKIHRRAARGAGRKKKQ
jgi:hypothetical protein